MPYRIRRRPLDTEIRALDSALFPGCPESEENAQACVWWGLEDLSDEDGPDLVGFCAARILRPTEPGAGAAYLARYGVAGSHVGKGLGKRLLRAASRWAKREGCREIQTYTIDNPESANALIAVGYRQFCCPWVIAGPGVSYWRKRL